MSGYLKRLLVGQSASCLEIAAALGPGTVKWTCTGADAARLAFTGHPAGSRQ